VDRAPWHAVGSGAIGPRQRIGLAQHRHVQSLGPVEPCRARLTPWVAGVLHVAEGRVELLREAALLQHGVAPNLDDRVDMLNQHRAALDAPPTGRALPDRLLGDGVVDERQRQRLLGPVVGELERVVRRRHPAVRPALPRALCRCGRRERGLGHQDLVAHALHQVLG
jgi:hypothetical protein